MRTLYLVWNEKQNECVGFFDKTDANWTSTGKRSPFKTSLGDPTIGDHFREQYAEDEDGNTTKTLPITKVKLA